MDTVFGIGHPFQQAMRLSANRVNGPGVADMKGGLCVLLEALKQFEKYYPDAALGWEVLINPDEEIGSLGSAPYLRERALVHDVGLLFEPAMDEMGTLAGIRKGSGRFVVIVHGHAAHAGRDFEEGRNAIVLLSAMMVEIHALNAKRQGVTINVGQVEGGGSVNVVPALAICRIDVRIQSETDIAWVKESLEKIVAKANQTPGFSVEYQGNFNRKPKELAGKTEALYDLVYAVGQEIGQTIAWKPSGGCCDGNNLADAGLPNIDTLGVSGGKIHSDAEYLLTDSLVERTKLTVALLLKLSEGLPILKRTSL
jgi:glutamate carboxypeptidase